MILSAGYAAAYQLTCRALSCHVTRSVAAVAACAELGVHDNASRIQMSSRREGLPSNTINPPCSCANTLKAKNAKNGEGQHVLTCFQNKCGCLIAGENTSIDAGDSSLPFWRHGDLNICRRKSRRKLGKFEEAGPHV